AKSLKIIQGELESACRMDDLAAVNAKLRLCVKEICDEAERQSRRQSAIQNDLKDAVKLAPAASDVDAVTGLASVQSAIQAIHQSWESGEDTHLLAFGIERMQSINLRFGFHVGDQIMLLFAQHLAQHMDQADTLYRWRGPCFVAVSPRRVPVAMLTSIAAKVM